MKRLARFTPVLLFILSGSRDAALFVRPAHATFSAYYTVTVPRPGASELVVRWEFVGADEIREIRLPDAEGRLRSPSSSGVLTHEDQVWKWRLSGPYGHLTYRVEVNQHRGGRHQYDSYAGPNWIVTRGRILFPRAQIAYRERVLSFHNSRSDVQATIRFRLPRGWVATTAYPVETAESFRLPPGKGLPVPRGWFALGHVKSDERDVAGVRIEIARVPGSQLDAESTFTFLDATLPPLLKLLSGSQRARVAQKLLLVSAPDPMWRGGISGRNSFFLHGDRPLRDVDRTSPVLHELFHVLQPFRPAQDADWIVEGLAEFYSVELQRRAGLIDSKTYNQALRSFHRYGLWNVDLRQQRDNAATNNSAPLLMHVLDQRILKSTGGTRRLDDVVALLAQTQGLLTSKRFQSLSSMVAGKPLDSFFTKHVARGEPPRLNSAH